jgi:hypothetical protein
MVNVSSSPNDFLIHWGGSPTPTPIWVQGVGRMSADAACARTIPMFGSQ